MKTINFGIMASALCLTSVIFAEDFARTTAAEQFSLTHGFSQSSLPVLQHVATMAPAFVSSSLVTKLCAAPCAGLTTNGLKTTGAGWSLEVSAEGAAAQFGDLPIQARAHSLATDPARRMSAAALEAAGRRFVASNLSSVIVLGAGEELVPVRTSYRVEGGQDLRSGATTSAVAANRIVFGRTINGVPVVGGGSTVVITFANDLSVESFQYDWPKYEATNSQALANTAQLLQRVQTVVAARTGAAITKATPAAVGQAMVNSPIELTAGTKLEKLSCGYYDSGSSVRNASPVQPGCTYHAVMQDANGMRQGLAGAVPAGQQFASDPQWPETSVPGIAR
jgi:hypothetical protein